jgi:hypothetical protein
MPNIPTFRDLTKNTVHSFQKVMAGKGVSGTYDSKINNPVAPFPPVPIGLNPGLFGVWYDGYFDGDPSWFSTATPIGSGYKQSTCSEVNTDQNTSWQWTGYFKPSQDGNFKFRGYGDDYLLMWFGDDAKDGNFNLANMALSSYSNQESFTSDLLNLKSDTYYPIRLQWGHPPVITYNGMYLSVLSAGTVTPEDCDMFNNMFYNQTLDHTFWGKNVPAGVENIAYLSGAWSPASNPPEIVYSSDPVVLTLTDITIRLPSGTTTQVISAVLTSNGMNFVYNGHAYPAALWEPYGEQPTYDGGAGSSCRITWNDWVVFEQIDGNVTVYRDYSTSSTINTLRPALSGGQNGIMKVVLETVNSSLSAGLRFWYD